MPKEEPQNQCSLAGIRLLQPGCGHGYPRTTEPVPSSPSQAHSTIHYTSTGHTVPGQCPPHRPCAPPLACLLPTTTLVRQRRTRKHIQVPQRNCEGERVANAATAAAATTTTTTTSQDEQGHSARVGCSSRGERRANGVG
eukprot:216263-Rhodomonas_salina.5